MPLPVTIPDLRFEETFKAKLIKNAIEENKQKHTTKDGEVDTHISTSLVLKTLLVDQIIMPFVQSFLLASLLFYLRPFIAASARKGYTVGVSIVSFIKSTGRRMFFFNPAK